MKIQNNLESNKERTRNVVISMAALALLALLTILIFSEKGYDSDINDVFVVFWLSLLAISFIAFVILYYCWLYRAYENIGKLGKTKYSPWKALLLSLIPFVSLVYSFLILLEIYRNLSAVLKANDLKPLDISSTFIKFYWFFWIVSFLVFVLFLVSFVCVYWIVVKFQEGFSQLENLSEIELLDEK